MKLKQVEAEITKQVVDWLEAHGWRAIRYRQGMMTTPAGGVMPLGEKGMPDWAFLFYLPEGVVMHVWVEMKRPGARERCTCLDRAKKGKRGLCVSCGQAKWRREEMTRSGGRAVIIRCHGMHERAWVAGPDGLLSAVGTFEGWYAYRYSWLAEQKQGQIRLGV